MCVPWPLRWRVMEPSHLLLSETLCRTAHDWVLQVFNVGSPLLCENQEGPRTGGLRLPFLHQGIILSKALSVTATVHSHLLWVSLCSSHTDFTDSKYLYCSSCFSFFSLLFLLKWNQFWHFVYCIIYPHCMLLFVILEFIGTAQC